MGIVSAQQHPAPTKVNGMAVEVMGKPLTVAGETWVTLVPAGECELLWEWSLTTGRLILVRS